MKITKKIGIGLSLLGSIGILTTTLASCGSTATETRFDFTNQGTTEAFSDELKVASFNLSLAVDNKVSSLAGIDGNADGSDNYERWVNYFSIDHDTQEQLIKNWVTWRENITESTPAPKEGEAGYLTKTEIVQAERVIQIRNVAAIIQQQDPDILLLNEFNNDGFGSEETVKLFQKNYLSHGQYQEGTKAFTKDAKNTKKFEPVIYPSYESYSTNTGLKLGMDLDNDGIEDNSPEDSGGFGYYHGHYAFSLLSKYKIDKQNTRTFQNFLWKDLPGSEIPKIEDIGQVKDENGKDLKQPGNSRKWPTKNSQGYHLPEGMKQGDNWFTDEEWSKFRLSSKNHVDVPIKISKGGKEYTYHFLLSHPTPAAFELAAKVNEKRNAAEISFWDYYIGKDGVNNSFIYDDNGNTGGIQDPNARFFIMGDQNADPSSGAKTNKDAIYNLLSNSKVHKDYHNVKTGDQETLNNKVPHSNGGKNFPDQSNKPAHPFKQQMTAVFRKRVDYSVPSANMNSISNGVFWPDTNEPYYNLFVDSLFNPVVSNTSQTSTKEYNYQPIIGKDGTSKTVSSDHRFVFSTIKL